MTTVLSVTVRDPDTPVEVYNVFVGVQEEAHDGTLLTDYTAEKLGWRLKWTVLTAAQRNTIMTQYATRTSQTFQPPYTTTTYSVVVKVDTLKETAHKGASTIYDVSFDVEEAS